MSGKETMTSIVPLREFVADMTELVSLEHQEAVLLTKGTELLTQLVSDDDWLPDPYAEPDPNSYRQNLLWCDPLERFSLVSFVWGPGQTTPIHDHTVWGLIGMLRGSEVGENFSIGSDGTPTKTGDEVLTPGMVSAVSPSLGDIHKVSNALADKPSISIHVYGANIGAVRRHVYEPNTGTPKDFVSGYSNEAVPNLFDRSAEIRDANS
ncbi:MAG: cysteine dioxygenase [Alphaproteobacteria bacterium]|nr:cysteine dioxygenase [Alphaproteobacteria bacterium]